MKKETATAGCRIMKDGVIIFDNNFTLLKVTETREAQLLNIIKVIDYLNNIDLDEQNEFINSLTKF